MPTIGHRVNGLRIAQARLKLKGSPNQREFADRLGIHWVTMSRIENGKANVSLDLLERIAEATGESRDHFLAGSDEDEEAAPVRSLATDLQNLAALAALLEANPGLLKEIA